MKKVSIIIPTYNQEEYINKAIDSALNQDYENMEVVLSDDNSNDKTSSIVKKYKKDKRFRYFKNKRNIGRVSNYHKALYEYARGEYALVLDGDDYLIDNSYISKAMDLIEKHKLTAVFANQKVFIKNKNKFVLDKMNNTLPKIIDGNWFFINYPKGYSVPHLTTLYDRRYAMKIDYYRKDILSSDWESFLRLIVNNKIGFIKEYVGVWNKHEDNASKNSKLDTIFKNTKFIDGPYEFYTNNLEFDKLTLNKWRKNMLKRYFIKNILKLLIQKDNLGYILFLREIKKRYSLNLYYSIVLDLRFILMKIALKSKYFTYFVFKNIVKNESYLEDLNNGKS